MRCRIKDRLRYKDPYTFGILCNEWKTILKECFEKTNICIPRIRNFCKSLIEQDACGCDIIQIHASTLKGLINKKEPIKSKPLTQLSYKILIELLTCMVGFLKKIHN